MKTIANILHQQTFPLGILDSNGFEVYYEEDCGYWSIYEYNSNGQETLWRRSNGYWVKREYDDNGSPCYYENSDGKFLGEKW